MDSHIRKGHIFLLTTPTPTSFPPARMVISAIRLHPEEVKPGFRELRINQSEAHTQRHCVNT
jgi:hypothetical protein